MNCSKCKAILAADRLKCPRCGTVRSAVTPTFADMIKDRPWLIALLSASAMLSLWLMTRRAPPPPPPEPIKVVTEPVAEPEPAAEPATMPAPMPVAQPAPEPAAPEPAKVVNSQDEPPPPPSSPPQEQSDGTWRSGPAAP